MGGTGPGRRANFTHVRLFSGYCDWNGFHRAPTVLPPLSGRRQSGDGGPAVEAASRAVAVAVAVSVAAPE